MQSQADEITHAMATIFVWLRCSSSRQLTWDWHENRPPAFNEAQACLTHAIAQVTPRYWAYVIFMLCDVAHPGSNQMCHSKLLSAVPLKAVFNHVEPAYRICAVHNVSR